jgi:hypothetical protein
MPRLSKLGPICLAPAANGGPKTTEAATMIANAFLRFVFSFYIKFLVFLAECRCYL